MIVCPNCNHQNPDGAIQCEACYTPLPATTDCPSCGASVQADAAFCGQCGYNLQSTTPTAVAPTVAPDIPDIPPLSAPDPLVTPQPVATTGSGKMPNSSPLPPTVVANPTPMATGGASITPPPAPTPTPMPIPVAPPQPSPPPMMPAGNQNRTQLQQTSAKLIHVQTDRQIELPANLSVVHIGKQNDRIPPDIDVSGFPNSEIVSRIHSDIRIEGDAFYIEDVGSSNGTYINNLPLLPGNRHRLRPGDRISLGKGDLVTFIFQLS